MFKNAAGIVVPQGQLPSKYGIFNVNVSTCFGIYQAVKYNKPIIERNISISGEGIVHPCNLRVRVGTPIKSVIQLAGGYKDPDKPKVFILGGPMMGASLPSDDTIITKTVTSIIVLNPVNEKVEPCIRCGSCVLSCPVGLQPVQIMDTVVYILVIASLVQIVGLFIKKYSPALYKSLGIYLPLITTNCAVLGVVQENTDTQLTFALSMANALGTSLGYLLMPPSRKGTMPKSSVIL